MHLRFASLSGALLVVALTAAACSPQRTSEAYDVLQDIAAGHGPSTLKENTPAPTRVTIDYEVGDTAYAADLYQPGDRTRAGLVLVPGVTPDGKDDTRLVAVANTLARARFVVLVPDMPNLRDLKVRPNDAHHIADAIRHLARAGGPEAKVGLVAISYAAGPAVLAALEPGAQERVAFIVAIGGYHDIEALATFFTTGHYRTGPDEPWQHRAPNPRAKWIFVQSNTELIEDVTDRALLSEMAARKLDDPQAEISDLTAQLGPEGRSIYALLENDDPDAVPGLIAAQPRAIRDDMAALDLARRDLSGLGAELILVHGRDDPVIPHTESRALEAAAPEGTATAYIVDSLAHVDLGPTDWSDGMRLWQAVYRLLEARDSAPEWPIEPPNKPGQAAHEGHIKAAALTPG